MSDQHVLRRRVGVTDAVFIILGNIIGIGIFLMPAVVAQGAGDPYLFLVLWLVGALIALAGGLSSAELGIMMPRAGGDYVFLRETYGLPWGFLYGYLSLTITYTGSIAAMAVGVAQYQGSTIAKWLGCGHASGADLASGQTCLQNSLISFDIPEIGAGTWLHFSGMTYSFDNVHIVAIVIVLFLTYLNHIGITRSLLLQKAVTIAPVVFLAVAGIAIIIDGLFIDESVWQTFSANLSGEYTIVGDAAKRISEAPLIAQIGMAMIPVFFTYTGWNVTLYLAEDIKDPERVIPRSMLYGIGLVAGVYMLFCMVLLATIPFGDIVAGTGDLSARALSVVFGDLAGTFMTFVVAFLVLGTLNTTVLSGSRVYLAMARDGIFFRRARELHPRYETPTWSLWLQCLGACLLILIFLDFGTIVDLTTIMMMFLSIMTISSVFILRRRHRKNPATAARHEGGRVRALGYPYLPAFYVTSVVLILAVNIYFDAGSRLEALLGIVVALIGFGMYYLWRSVFASPGNGPTNGDQDARPVEYETMMEDEAGERQDERAS